MGEFRMPSLGADMEKGTLLEWLVKPGDVVHRGDIVAVIDTEKSDIEVEVYEDGVVGELLVAEGEEVPVGTPLATIVGEAASAAPAPPTAPRAPAPAPAPPAAPPSPPPTSTGVRASPLARRRASETGIDLAGVAGTGPGGAVVAADIRPEPPTTVEEPVDRSARMRGAIASAMARSKREIPHYYLSTTIDLGDTMTWLRQLNEGRPVAHRILPAALLLCATARAAAEHPELNGHWIDGHRPAQTVHLGVAISLREGGLVAPGIPDAHTCTLPAVMAAMRDLVQRTRAGRLRQSEMTDPTITVTNLGDLGVDSVLGVIHPPQLAMVGFGAIHDQPVCVDGAVVARPAVIASLAADHRASDGMQGAAFLADIGRILHDPDQLLEEDR